MKTYSSSDLKVKTASVLKDVESAEYGAVLIETRSEPRAVLVNYKKWLEMTAQSTDKRMNLITEYNQKAKESRTGKGKVDSAKIIRELRDNDYE